MNGIVSQPRRPTRPTATVVADEPWATKTRILDAAEATFAKVGYFAATIRCITKEAGVPLNLARYHCGSKAELIQSVIARRADAICRQLELALANALSSPAENRQEAVIAAMVSTSVNRLKEGDIGWRNYFKLLAHLSALEDRPDLAKPFRSRYEGTLSAYRKALQDATPDATEDTVDWALHFVQVLLGHAFLDLGLIRYLGGSPSKDLDWDELGEQLVAHVVGGLRAQVALQGRVRTGRCAKASRIGIFSNTHNEPNKKHSAAAVTNRARSLKASAVSITTKE